MTWKPLEPEALWKLMRSETSDLEDHERCLYDRYSVAPYPAACQRAGRSEMETVFVEDNSSG